MADISDLKVQVTLTIGELKQIIALMNFAHERLAGDVDEATEVLVDEVSGLYFQLMENLNNGYLGEFDPEG